MSDFFPAEQPEGFEERCQRFFVGVGAFQEAVFNDPETRARFEAAFEAWDDVLSDGLIPDSDKELESGTVRSIDPFPFSPKDDRRSLQKFGRWLVRLRLRADFKSQDAVIAAIKRGLPQGSESQRSISKSMLSLYERGEIQTLRPWILWVLSQLYCVSYTLMIQCWTEARYHVRVH